MTVSSKKDPSNSTEAGALRVLRYILLGNAAIAAITQLVVWILLYHLRMEGIRWMLLSATLAAPAFAAPIEYQVLFGKDDGFASSLIHDGEGSDVHEGGAVGGLEGTLTFDYDLATDIHTLVESTTVLLAVGVSCDRFSIAS